MNEFKWYEFDEMREWLKTLAGTFEIRRARISIFDRYRYLEQYDNLLDFIIEMGGMITKN